MGFCSLQVERGILVKGQPRRSHCHTWRQHLHSALYSALYDPCPQLSILTARKAISKASVLLDGGQDMGKTLSFLRAVRQLVALATQLSLQAASLSPGSSTTCSNV